MSSKKSFWDIVTFKKVGAGWLKFWAIFLFALISFFGLRFGYLLTLKGIRGEFTFLIDRFKGLTLYFTSVAPGALFVLAAIIIFCWGLPKTLKYLKR